jgi:hypothetical protein
MEGRGSPETLLYFYHDTRHHIPEGNNNFSEATPEKQNVNLTVLQRRQGEACPRVLCELKTSATRSCFRCCTDTRCVFE